MPRNTSTRENSVRSKLLAWTFALACSHCGPIAAARIEPAASKPGVSAPGPGTQSSQTVHSSIVTPRASVVVAPLVPAPLVLSAFSERLRAGVIHSLSGTMGPVEAPMSQMATMAIEELNQEGGVLGRRVEPLLVDPGSDWVRTAQMARELIQRHEVHVLFGGYTSVSRKAMLPVIEELNGLLFYPAQYEGEAPSNNLAYTGAVPNQAAELVATYLAEQKPAFERWLVLGQDSITPRVEANVIRNALIARGVPPEHILIQFVPFGTLDFQTIVRDQRAFSYGKRSALISSLFDDSVLPFQRELRKQGIDPRTQTQVALTLDERIVADQGQLFVGTLLGRSYFSVLENPANAEFKRRWARYVKDKALPPKHAFLSDDMEATYLGVKLWKQAVESAQSVDPARVLDALANQSIAAPSGFTIHVDAKNHHLHKPYFLAKVGRDGKVSVVWQTPALIAPAARTQKGFVADMFGG